MITYINLTLKKKTKVLFYIDSYEDFGYYIFKVLFCNQFISFKITCFLYSLKTIIIKSFLVIKKLKKLS